MAGSIKKSALYRKGNALLFGLTQASRRMVSGRNKDEDLPPIVANSIPKSGTHLLIQILGALPGYRNYSRFIASTPSVSMKKRSDASITRMIRNLAPGEICGAHMHHSESIQQALRDRGAISFFIYRDPRAVFFSEMQYLLTMNRWHRAGRFARKLQSQDDVFDFFINGLPESSRAGFDWPRYSDRIIPYLGWFEDEASFRCSYEALRSDESRPGIVEQAARFISERATLEGNVSHTELTENLNAAVNPKASHTFRKGTKNEWQSRLSDAEIALLEREVDRIGFPSSLVG